MARTRRTAEDAREAIRGAAVELFVAGGYGATSLEDIARQVGLTRQAALYHFRTKEELLRSVVDPYLDEVTALLDPIEVSDHSTAQERRDTLRPSSTTGGAPRRGLPPEPVHHRQHHRRAGSTAGRARQPDEDGPRRLGGGYRSHRPDPRVRRDGRTHRGHVRPRRDPARGTRGSTALIEAVMAMLDADG